MQQFRVRYLASPFNPAGRLPITPVVTALPQRRANVFVSDVRAAMPQSMLAFLAIMIAGISAINQQSRQLATYNEMILSEYLLTANAAVIEQMEIISASVDFDDLQSWDGQQVQRSFEAGEVVLDFDLTVSVQYTDEDGNPETGPTDTQEVTISATHDRFQTSLVTHSRLISD
jgi:hypothetical protein